MKRKLLLINAALLLLLGLMVAFYPKLNQVRTDIGVSEEVQIFYREASREADPSGNRARHVDPTSIPPQSGETPDPERPFSELYQAMVAHNRFGSIIFLV